MALHTPLKRNMKFYNKVSIVNETGCDNNHLWLKNRIVCEKFIFSSGALIPISSNCSKYKQAKTNSKNI